jgi:flagellar hook-associated protein 1 FlgK
MSLNSALRVAGRSLDIFTTGIEVAGNNISNSSTPGYIREEMYLEPSNPYLRGGVVVGSGANISGVRQQVDLFLEKRIYQSNGEYSASNNRLSAYTDLQSIISELGDQDLSTGLNNFLSSIQEVVNQPESSNLKSLVVQQGSTLVGQIQDIRERVDQQRITSSTQIKSSVDEVNKLVDQIAGLNTKIVKMESAGLLGSEAGDLRTQRLNAIGRLSELVPVKTVNHDNGMVDVYMNNEYMVYGSLTQHLEAVQDPTQGPGINQIQMKETKAPLTLSTGEISGLIQGRDQVLGGFIDSLDQLASSVIESVNKLHSSGEGTKKFTDVTSTNYVTSTNTPLNNSGLKFNPENGSFEIKILNKDTGLTDTRTINIDLDGLNGNDTSLEDLRASLDGIDHINATITADGKLKLNSDDGFEFSFGNDNSGTLAALGINTFFTGHDSSDIGINSMLVKDPSYLATGQGGGSADNRNAIELAKFLDNTQTSLGGLSISDFYDGVVSNVTQAAASETSLNTGLSGYASSLSSQKQQVSGVSIDEEAIRILQYQQSYQAAAKIISTIDELFNTLLNSV